MNLKVLSNVVKSKATRQLFTMRKHSPVILFGAGVVGIVGTVVLASRATLKLEDVLQEVEENVEKANGLVHVDYSNQDRNRDIAIIYARAAGKITRMYTPSIILGTLSVAALTGSHVILSRRNIALTAAYGALDRGFRHYRARVIKELGPDKDREFLHDIEDVEIIEHTAEGPVAKTVKQIGPNATSIYARFFDESNLNWQKNPHYNQFFIKCQQNYANDLLRSRGHVFLNEVYDMLGLPRTKEGQIVGWTSSDCQGDGYIDFGIFDDAYSGMRFAQGDTRSVLLDFNVDGIIFDKI